MTRPTIDETMLAIASVLSKRATCLKRKVGCVITDINNNILSTGYNGAPKGAPHCDEYSPCPAYIDASISCHAIHAEINTLIRCSDIDKAYKIYVTEKPCAKCQLSIDNTNIKFVIFPESLI